MGVGRFFEVNYLCKLLVNEKYPPDQNALAMIKLRFNSLMALLVVAALVFADNAPVKVQTALKKTYPKVNGTTWLQDGGYYYVDFMMNGYEENVWLNVQEQWQMTQTRWEDTGELSAMTYSAYTSGPYSGW